MYTTIRAEVVCSIYHARKLAAQAGLLANVDLFVRANTKRNVRVQSLFFDKPCKFRVPATKLQSHRI